MSAVLTIAITLVAGAALFGYINDQAANSEQALGSAVGGTANFLNEKFVIFDLSLAQSCSPQPSPCATVWLYNSGEINLQLSSIHLYDSARALSITYTKGATSSGPCASGSGALPSVNLVALNPPQQLTLSLPAGCSFGPPGTVYYVSILGLYGNVVVSFVVK